MKSALVLGGSSVVGKKIITKFKSTSPYWNILNIDHTENKEATKNIIIPKNFTKIDLTDFRKSIEGNFDFIINTNGSFVKTRLENYMVLENLDYLHNISVSSSVLSAYLAKKYLNPNSLFVLLGSYETKQQKTSENILFNLVKNDIHHLTEILLNNPKELPENTKIITLLMYDMLNKYIFYFFIGK